MIQPTKRAANLATSRNESSFGLLSGIITVKLTLMAYNLTVVPPKLKVSIGTLTGSHTLPKATIGSNDRKCSKLPLAATDLA